MEISSQGKKVCSKRACSRQVCKNVLVTGGAQGIGKAIVDKLRLRGDRVFVFDILPSDDENYVQTDVSSFDSIKKSFEKLFDILGDEPLDVLVNNAGITRDMLALRMSIDQWDDVLSVNLSGAFFCAQQALKKMIKQKKSYIINMASVVGVVGNPGQINYAASKAGLIAVTKTLAKEYAGRNILVNAIAPGFIQTEMTKKLSEKNKTEALYHIPLKRLGAPEDVANLVCFLTSELADYLTGQVIHVDGGMVI